MPARHRSSPDPVASVDLLPELPPPRSLITEGGRSVETWTVGDVDRLVVRSTSGAIVLQIDLTDAGPRLSFSSAELELLGARRIRLEAPEVEVSAKRHIRLATEGDVVSEAGRHQDISAGAAIRMEGGAVELQASDTHILARASGRIGLDGEHIGLNDDPSPVPFGWSKLEREGLDR